MSRTLKTALITLCAVTALFIACHVSYIPARWEENVVYTERFDNQSDRVFYGDRTYATGRIVLHVEVPQY